MAKGRRPPSIGGTKPKSGSDTTKLPYANEDGGCARPDSEGTRRRPKLGEGCVLPPNQEPPRSSRPARAESKETAAQRNLGLRSHSGNSPEADAEG